jgi:uncharacterized protein (DUF3084 family)
MNAKELADELESCRDCELPAFVHKTATMLRQQQALIKQRNDEIKAFHNLVTEQDKKIIDLAFKLAYAERSAQLAYDPKKHGAEE